MMNDAIFKEDQTSAWKYLKYELARKKPSQVRWCCWPKKVDCSAASRLAQLMLKSRDKFYSSTEEIEEYERTCTDREEEESLPRCDKPQQWTEFSHWKHPELGLNLLQLAIVCGHHSGVKYLWQDCFKEKQKYLDASSRLVNHPWHLIFVFGTEYYAVLPIEETDVDFFLEEGEVDLKAELLCKWPATERLVRSRADIVLAGSKLGLDWMEVDRGLRFCLYVLSEFVSQLFTSQATISTVESLKKLLWDNPFGCRDICEFLMEMWITALCYIDGFDDPVPEWRIQLAEELLILICQMWSWIESTPDLKNLYRVFIGACAFGVPLLEAARYLHPSHLVQVVELIKNYRSVHVWPFSQSLLKNLVALTSGVTRLRHLCVLSILRAVKGDARKVWKMSEIPEPLKELFHVPFKALPE